MSKNLVDPWTLNPDGTPDPFAANINWNMPDLPDLDHQYEGDPVIESREGLEPEIVVVEGGVRKVDPEPIVEEPEPDPDSPEVYDVEDGTVTLEKERGQWKATLANNTGGNPQVYWGKNKNELLIGVMKAQLNATKKIRELNAKVKFNNTPQVQKPAESPRPATRNLTADEVFEIKTQLESDPALALDNLFQKRTGLTIEQLVKLAQQGAQQGAYASNQLVSETANTTFLANNPDYYADASSQNHRQLIRWIAKFKLGEAVSLENAYSAYDKVISSGVYTTENLEEAFEDLKSDGLMLSAPRQPKQVSHNANTPPPVAVQHEPAPAPRPDSRIVKQETRPRAALGIGRNDVTPVKPIDTPNAPSAEDLDSMSDDQISALLAGVQKQLRSSRR